jgi:hypothetical protein
MENIKLRLFPLFFKKYFGGGLHFFLLILSYALIFDSSAQEEIVVVRRMETDEVLTNPGKGFTTFQCFNGDYDPYAEGGIRESGGRLVPDCYSEPVTYKFDPTMSKLNHPRSSVAYFRINWSFIEPEEKKYNWEFIDSLLVTGAERNQRLLIRIAPFSGSFDSEYKKDVPYWFREKIGHTDIKSVPHVFWFFDHNDPLYLEHFGAMIREFGRRYDGHPMIEAVDLSIGGQAGEGVAINLLEEGIRKGLIRAYTDSFRKTPLIVLGRTDQTEHNVYHLAREQGLDVGWRVDCLGDMFGFSDAYNHMFDYYPQAINQGMKAQDAWKKAPVSFESCWTMKHWKDQGWDIDYIIDQSLKWNISTFNNKSSAVPEEWRPQVDRWIRSMGYRFVLRKFTYPEEVRQNSGLSFTTWWENTGVAPIYRDYTLALRLKGDKESRVLTTDADITTWLPGDNLYDNSVFVPLDMPPGEYNLQIGIVDPHTSVPAVNLAITGREDDGWYHLGDIVVKK